jgi:hypothetical protein
MSSRNSSLHERALKRALAHESVDLLWESASGTVAFSAAKNPLPKSGLTIGGGVDPVDRNDGDDTACTLTAVVTEDADATGVLHSDNVPDQGQVFTDGAGNTYRVGKRDWTPGLPKAVFHIPNVATP